MLGIRPLAALFAAVFLAMAAPGAQAKGGHASHAKSSSHVGKFKSTRMRSWHHSRSGFRARHMSRHVLSRGVRPSAHLPTMVSAHYTRKGTFVQAHMRTSPNDTKNDNFSTRGNVNPYTGKAGTKPRDGE